MTRKTSVSSPSAEQKLWATTDSQSGKVPAQRPDTIAIFNPSVLACTRIARIAGRVASPRWSLLRTRTTGA